MPAAPQPVIFQAVSTVGHHVLQLNDCWASMSTVQVHITRTVLECAPRLDGPLAGRQFNTTYRAYCDTLFMVYGIRSLNVLLCHRAVARRKCVGC